jgi:hypothetical protein
MRRNHLKGRDGDRINAVLAVAYNFSLLLRCFEELLRVLLSILCRDLPAAPLHKSVLRNILHGRLSQVLHRRGVFPAGVPA